MIIELKHREEVGYAEKEALMKALLKLSKEHNVDFSVLVGLEVENLFQHVEQD